MTDTPTKPCSCGKPMELVPNTMLAWGRSYSSWICYDCNIQTECAGTFEQMAKDRTQIAGT